MNWWEDPNELKVARKRIGITQFALAKLSGVNRAIIASIESGRQVLKLDAGGAELWGALAALAMSEAIENFLC